MNLLIVDDEILAVQGILDGVEWDKLAFDKVLTANSYAQAVNLFLEMTIDVMLCDIEMPYGSGMELVEWVKGHSPQTECIFLTGHDEFSFAKRAISLQCRDYILKPAPIPVLMETLEKAIQAVRAREIRQKYENFGKIYVQSMTEDPKEEDTEDIVEHIAKYIEVHIADALSVESLAREAHLSPDYLSRSFKKKYNMTLIDYITEQRMFLAKELLLQNRMSVSMVSAKVGYSNYSYFTKIFKKYYGVLPSEMQRSGRK